MKTIAILLLGLALALAEEKPTVGDMPEFLWSHEDNAQILAIKPYPDLDNPRMVATLSVVLKSRTTGAVTFYAHKAGKLMGALVEAMACADETTIFIDPDWILTFDPKTRSVELFVDRKDEKFKIVLSKEEVQKLIKCILRHFQPTE